MQEEKKVKRVKPVKIPSTFKKPIKKKTFERNFAKFIEHPVDKKFFVSSFELKNITVKKKSIDCYVICDGITKENAKKLKSLLKVIKQNRKGPINYIPLTFASILISAIVIFFLVFANPLLGRALEKGLEAVFEAKADVENFRLSLIKFEISMSSITVANRERPMTNLFQMGETTIRLRPEAVLRGKVYIDDIIVPDIRFGTPRTVSGSIGPLRERPAKQPLEFPPLVDLKNFDAMALLNQEYDKLNTPKLLDEITEAYSEILLKWQEQIETTKQQTEELRSAAAPLQSLNINNFNIRDPQTINTVRAAITDINNMVSTAQTAASHAGTLISGVEDDIALARLLESNARNAITDDLNFFRSFIDLNSGTAYSLLESVIMDMLTDTASEYIEYGLIAVEALQKIKEVTSSGAEKPEKEPEFRGRDIHYRAIAFPAFYLGQLSTNITSNTWRGSFDLRNISTHPNFTEHSPDSNRPVSLILNFNEIINDQRNASLNGRADFRAGAQQRFNTDLNANNLPFKMEGQLGNIGINGFTGDSNILLNITGLPNGTLSATANLILNNSAIINPFGTIADALDAAIQQAENVNIRIRYTFNADRSDSFSLTSNIDDLFAQAIRDITGQYAARAMQEIERALRSKLDEFLDNSNYRNEIDQLLNVLKGDREFIDQMRGDLGSKANEFEQSLRSMTGMLEDTARQYVDDAARLAEDTARQAIEEAERLTQAAISEAERLAQAARDEAERLAQAAQEEAERAAEQALRDALQGNVPAIQPPAINLPRIPGR
ncbi:MAG: hypothetical protein LBC80_09700 [Treponema sp.]|jgi:uncharacterized protein (TIGR03545 family)|nr:hypothetical protein [Treponema sp.]